MLTGPMRKSIFRCAEIRLLVARSMHDLFDSPSNWFESSEISVQLRQLALVPSAIVLFGDAM
jgi:hypothetical protein